VVPRREVPGGGAFACARETSWGCRVVIAPEPDAKRVGLTRDILLRHEIAHCNGWPGDHRGTLPIVDLAPMDIPEDASDKTPLQPSAPQQPVSPPCGIAIQKPCE
jgi:hypothetical protein